MMTTNHLHLKKPAAMTTNHLTTPAAMTTNHLTAKAVRRITPKVAQVERQIRNQKILVILSVNLTIAQVLEIRKKQNVQPAQSAKSVKALRIRFVRSLGVKPV